MAVPHIKKSCGLTLLTCMIWCLPTNSTTMFLFIRDPVPGVCCCSSGDPVPSVCAAHQGPCAQCVLLLIRGPCAQCVCCSSGTLCPVCAAAHQGTLCPVCCCSSGDPVPSVCCCSSGDPVCAAALMLQVVTYRPNSVSQRRMPPPPPTMLIYTVIRVCFQNPPHLYWSMSKWTHHILV